MSTKLTAVNGHIIVTPLDLGDFMEGNIIIPDMGRERPNIGVVLGVSDVFNFNMGEYVPSIFKEGMKVLYPSFSGTSITVEGEEYILVQSGAIFGILEE